MEKGERRARDGEEQRNRQAMRKNKRQASDGEEQDKAKLWGRAREVMEKEQQETGE